MAKKTPESSSDPITQALQIIRKDLDDDNIVMDGIDKATVVLCDAISTGALTLDAALGIGGIPRGRITEVYGPEGCGKTTSALYVARNAQRNGGRVLFIDIEHAVDMVYANALGVDLDTLLFTQPDTAEQAFMIMEKLLETGKVDLVVLDSVAALMTQKELDGEVGDQHIAAVARFMSQNLKKIKGLLSKHNAAMIFINQIRHKIGGMSFGSNETTPGGRALKFYASVRIDMRKIGTVKSGEEGIGSRVRCKIVKNKVSAPFRQAEFDIRWGEGIDEHACVLDAAVEHKLVSKKGNHYSLNDGTILGNGREKAIKFLKEDDDIFQALHKDMYAILLPHLVKKEEVVVGE